MSDASRRDDVLGDTPHQRVETDSEGSGSEREGGRDREVPARGDGAAGDGSSMRRYTHAELRNMSFLERLEAYESLRKEVRCPLTRCRGPSLRSGYR